MLRKHEQTVLPDYVCCTGFICFSTNLGLEEYNQTAGSDYESEGGFVCCLIVLIRSMAADLFISSAGAMPGDGRQQAEEQKLINEKNKSKQSTGSRAVPYGMCMKTEAKQETNSYSFQMRPDIRYWSGSDWFQFVPGISNRILHLRRRAVSENSFSPSVSRRPPGRSQKDL